jgi:hypothetical protein
MRATDPRVVLFPELESLKQRAVRRVAHVMAGGFGLRLESEQHILVR